jgi:DNA-binding NtrC family response regulator
MSESIERVVSRLRRKGALDKLVGGAPIFLRAIAQLEAVAKGNAPVLIDGETGTGKDLVARVIHYLGGRAAFPFVAVNCGSLVDTLLEDELFGHERGAFTDARGQRPGLAAQAEKGTLFLDEVGTLSPRGQVTLLRFLHDRTFRPLGSAGERQADVRFVAATNAPLEERVRLGSFRADLYYRLRVFSISLPPLRNRLEDISVLTAHFLKLHAPHGRESLTLSEAARARLLAYDWPGNVRELENTIIRAAHTASGDLIDVEDLALAEADAARSPEVLSGRGLGPFQDSKRKAIEVFERDYLRRLMIEHQGNVTHAARSAGKDRRDLGKLLKKHGLSSADRDRPVC